MYGMTVMYENVHPPMNNAIARICKMSEEDANFLKRSYGLPEAKLLPIPGK